MKHLIKIKLVRVAYSEHGTFGVLIENDIAFAVTLERPWKNNKRGISCIPAANYICQRTDKATHKNVFEIMHVPNRSDILFHKGNIIDHSEGCILIGEQFGILRGIPAITHSGIGYNEFMEKLTNLNLFELEIVGEF